MNYKFSRVIVQVIFVASIAGCQATDTGSSSSMAKDSKTTASSMKQPPQQASDDSAQKHYNPAWLEGLAGKPLNCGRYWVTVQANGEFANGAVVGTWEPIPGGWRRTIGSYTEDQQIRRTGNTLEVDTPRGTVTCKG